MKIVSSAGCVNWGLTVDGEDFRNLPFEKRKEIAIKMIELLEERDDDILLQSLVIDITDIYGKETASGYCSQCHDYWSETTLEI